MQKRKDFIVPSMALITPLLLHEPGSDKPSGSSAGGGGHFCSK